MYAPICLEIHNVVVANQSLKKKKTLHLNQVVLYV